MKTKIAAIAVLALVMVAVAPAVSAQPFEKSRERYDEAKNDYHDSYSQWQGSRVDFNQAMANWRGNRTQNNFSQLMNAAKVAAGKAGDMMIRNMEMIRARVEVTTGLSDNQKNQLYSEIDGYLNEIRAKQLSIQNAGDDQQIRATAGELNQLWMQIRLRLKQMTGSVMVHFGEAVVQRVEAFAARIEARIQLMKDNGIDTSALENGLTDLRSKIDMAKQRIADAWDEVGQITDDVTFSDIFRAAQNRTREAVSYLKDALKGIKNIMSEMNRMGHTVTITGSGTLIAQGNGSVHITGTGTVEVKAQIDGNMIVSPNATVTTSGESTEEILGNGWIKYQGYDNAVVVGTDITVDINGNGIDVVASGTGTVKLVGNGSYSTYGENYYVDGTWNTAGVGVTLESGEAA